MRQERNGLRLLDGFWNSRVDARPDHGSTHSRLHEGSSPLPGTPKKEELKDALKTMERRLSTLLNDRTHLGRDLHDGVLQSLYAIGLSIETTRRGEPRMTPQSQHSIAGIVGQINRLIDEIRHMIRRLEEGVVHEFDLKAELQALKTAYDQVGHIRITLDLQSAAIEILTKEEEREILHIVREALNNCVRHAHAAHAKIAIRKRGEKILVTVCDDGTGFTTAAGSIKRGYGLANMEARAKKIGGTLRVQSEPGHGTDITAEFSLEPILVPV